MDNFSANVLWVKNPTQWRMEIPFAGKEVLVFKAGETRPVTESAARWFAERIARIWLTKEDPTLASTIDPNKVAEKVSQILFESMPVEKAIEVIEETKEVQEEVSHETDIDKMSYRDLQKEAAKHNIPGNQPKNKLLEALKALK